MGFSCDQFPAIGKQLLCKGCNDYLSRNVDASKSSYSVPTSANARADAVENAYKYDYFNKLTIGFLARLDIVAQKEVRFQRVCDDDDELLDNERRAGRADALLVRQAVHWTT
jgi:hypothetical protein